MKAARTLLALLLFLNGIPITVAAQAESQVFALPDAVAGETYRANVETILRDTYQLKLESTARISNYRWFATVGQLPPGLLIRANGSIVGVPRVPRPEPYRFQVKVLDVSSASSEPLTLDLTMMIAPARVRLAHINTPRLVSLEGPNAISPKEKEVTQRNNQSPDSTRDRKAEPGTRTNWTTESVYASMLRKSSDENSAAKNDAASVPSTPPSATDCNTTCEPKPEANDFIIDAATGATSGKTRLKRTDRARIIIKNKNPFLYEYRVTIEDKKVEEPALTSLEELFGSIGKGTFPTASVNDKNAAEKATNAVNDVNAAGAQSCPVMGYLLKLEDGLARDEDQLQPKIDQWTDLVNGIQEQSKQINARLVSPGAQCPALCSDAHSLVELLRGHLTGSSTSFDQFTKEVAAFQKHANALSAMVATLLEQDYACSRQIKDAHLDKLAAHHLEFAKTLNDGLDKLKRGRKSFDTAAKSIETVFATANAFYEVREKGDFNEATDVNIKIERKDVTKEKSEFASLVETKLNFGGGPRFALGGGLVASLLERAEYERVSTVVNGQVVNIVGLKRTSSSRVLPLLMLHTRLYNFRNDFIDGLHFSVGLTAKPNSEGTSAEFLFGPSISFAQGRMFLTAGGYMGKKQELQGSFTVGSQIPKDFGEDLPTSEHYVWKPGFAITYKIK